VAGITRHFYLISQLAKSHKLLFPLRLHVAIVAMNMLHGARCSVRPAQFERFICVARCEPNRHTASGECTEKKCL